MKKAFIAGLLVFVLLGLISQGVSAAIHNTKGDFTYINETGLMSDLMMPSYQGAWFTLGNLEPYMQGSLASSPHLQGAGFNYYQNDQTFTGGSLMFPPDSTVFTAKGSYLWDVGFFAGVQIDFIDDQFEAYISPGYRLNIGDIGYAAISIDYYTHTSKINGYDLDYKFTFDKWKFFGQMYALENGHFYGDVQANFKVVDTVVGGIKLSMNNEKLGYQTGISWVIDNITLNFKMGQGEIMAVDQFYTCGINYQINAQWDVGLDIQKNNNATSPLITLRAAYGSESIKWAAVIYNQDPFGF